MEAMEDFSGGVGEMYETKNPPNNLFNILKKAVERGSMLGCSIDVSIAVNRKKCFLDRKEDMDEPSFCKSSFILFFSDH